jgi:DNA-binding MarR family transcriptional regulator
MRMARAENLLGALALTLVDQMQQAEPAGAVSPHPSERAALATLLAHPRHTVSWLADVLGVTSSGGTRLVERMVARGWISRTTGVDARSRTLTLTRSGRTLATRVLAARADAVDAALAPLSDAQRGELERLLEPVVAGLATRRSSALRTCRLCDRSACAASGRDCPLDHTLDRDDTRD